MRDNDRSMYIFFKFSIKLIPLLINLNIYLWCKFNNCFKASLYVSG